MPAIRSPLVALPRVRCVLLVLLFRGAGALRVAPGTAPPVARAAVPNAQRLAARVVAVAAAPQETAPPTGEISEATFKTTPLTGVTLEVPS